MRLILEIWRYLLWHCSQVIATKHVWLQVNIGLVELKVWWPGAIRQQAITWANVDPDLCC